MYSFEETLTQKGNSPVYTYWEMFSLLKPWQLECVKIVTINMYRCPTCGVTGGANVTAQRSSSYGILHSYTYSVH